MHLSAVVVLVVPLLCPSANVWQVHFLKDSCFPCLGGFEWSYGFSELGTGGSKPNEQCVLQVTQDACGLWASCPSLHTKAPLKSKQQQEAQCVCCLYLGDFVSAVPGVFSSKPTHCVPHSYRAFDPGYSSDPVVPRDVRVCKQLSS